MSDTKYTYAVARIRALEVSLFSDAFIEQLLACRNADQVLQSVIEKGWAAWMPEMMRKQSSNAKRRKPGR